ncbi:dTDP-4-dehydrorhamnose reductase [Marinoscillum sp. MHG1-6]|uniref:dTDP-4-dehydrorhamnose reductase n=1 Tax=Marinoscillum sp. MHG1-6 TaxID=2959627 RepID=UPI002157D5F8|nr:dTDP-4-dehydrorhamnose reductase [Marinoscillum sp. MHG1-6]
MTIIVTGSDGQLGNELKTLAKGLDWNFIFTDYQELDITNKEAVTAFFQSNCPDYCINCAAYTAVDKAESEKEKADLINVTGAENLALACSKAGAPIIHISTDFVFDGTTSRPLNEDQPTTPINYYGESKLNGELKVNEVLKEHFILRTSWLYSTFGNNFVKTMLKLGTSKPELNIISDQIGTPTYARDLAKVIIKIIQDKSEAYGLYHYSNEGIASWYDFTKAIFEYAHISIPVNPIPTEKYPTPAARPAYSVMDKSKIKDTFDIEIPYWRDSLKECLKAL